MKKIKNIILFSCLLTLALSMGSCGKEDAPVVDINDPTDNFIPGDDETDATAELRRKFKEEEGSYLLFNDTLQKKELGIDITGETRYFIEVVDVSYTVGATSITTNPYTYTYLKTDEKRQAAVDYLKKYVLSHISKNIRPFSIFLASTISGKDVYNNVVKPYAVSGERCVCMACGQLNRLLTEDSKKKYARKILLVMVANIATNNESAFSKFKAVSEEYYGKNLQAPEGVDKNDFVRQYGFTSDIHGSYFMDYAEDVDSYASMVLTYTDEKIAAKYAGYPKIIEKARLFKEALTNLGYVF